MLYFLGGGGGNLLMATRRPEIPVKALKENITNHYFTHY